MALAVWRPRIAGRPKLLHLRSVKKSRLRSEPGGDRLGTPSPPEIEDKDTPLRYDIRLLGRILGETIRTQDGGQTFELVERIRQTALRFHRDADDIARQELQAIIEELPTTQAIWIIRAFGQDRKS